VSIVQKDEILVSSEIGWITKDKLVLTINDKYHLVNLQHNDLSEAKNHLKFGTQLANMGLYASIVKFSKNMDIESHRNEELIKANTSIQRMDMASLTRYAFI